MPRRRPHLEPAAWRSQSICEDESALLREPGGCLVAAAPVVEGDKAAGQLVARLHSLQLDLGDVVPEEEPRPVRPGSVALDESVDIADVIRLEDDHRRGRVGVEPAPHRILLVRRRERV